MSQTLSDRLDRAAGILRRCESVVVGFSGGVDSSLVARLARDALGAERVLAVTGLSPAVPEVQRRAARAFTAEQGIAYLEIETRELERSGYVRNHGDRCYHCKSELWPGLAAVAAARGFRALVDGANADDLSDHRPGARAAREHGVRSPLAEAGIDKAGVRAASRALGLDTWDAPAAPCLASRLAYGVPVSAERLARVERAEDGVRALGFREFRVRHHGDCARVEIAPEELHDGVRRAAALGSAVRAAGFARVLLDAEGYRRGALNEALRLVTLEAGRRGSIQRAVVLLRAGGVALRGASAAGAGRDILAVVVDPAELPRVRAVAPALRELGFRYVGAELEDGRRGSGARGNGARAEGAAHDRRLGV